MFTLIKNANLYAPDPVGKTDLLIAGTKIAAIERDLSVSGLDTLSILDVQGALVTPGFVDGHVHLIGGGGEGGFHTRTPEVNLNALIKGGVTTVVGLLGTDNTNRHVGSLFAKTKGLNTEGISAFMLTGGYKIPSPYATTSLQNDIVYLDPVIGLKTAISDHRSSHPDPQELIRAASDARVAGLLSGKAGCVVVHLGGGRHGFKLLEDVIETTEIPRQQFIPTHVNRKEFLFDQALHWTKAGGYIDLTAGINPGVGAKGSVKVSEAIAKCMREGYDMTRICVSSDANGSIPRFDENGQLDGITVAGFEPLLIELKDMVGDEKIPLEEALRPLTKAPAKSLGLSKSKGHIAVGMDADLLVMDADLSLTHVVAKGQRMMEDGVVVVKGTFET